MEGIISLQKGTSFIDRIWLLVEKAVALCLNRDKPDRTSSFDKILLTYDDMISRLCLGYSQSKEEFEDLRQDVYVNIWQGLEKFRGESSVKTWIYRVTLNTCVSIIRKRAKSGYPLMLNEIADIADESPDRLQQIADLYSSIDSLSPVDKAIVMLWLDELSYDEIATLVGMPRNTVATRLHRAKQKLRVVLSIGK